MPIWLPILLIVQEEARKYTGHNFISLVFSMVCLQASCQRVLSCSCWHSKCFEGYMQMVTIRLDFFELA
jgi:hypothetical protein